MEDYNLSLLAKADTGASTSPTHNVNKNFDSFLKQATVKPQQKPVLV